MDVFLTGILKKPFVAISLLIIIAMCLTVAEAAPRPEAHKKRHHRKQPDVVSKTKEPRLLARLTADTNQSNTIILYQNATEIVLSRLRNNIRFFGDEFLKYKGRDTVQNVKGNPSWLPKVNFVEIHKSKKQGLKRRFRYTMRKLYKHARQFGVLFELLNNVTIDYQSDLYDQLQQRNQMIFSCIDRVKRLIGDLQDAMGLVKMPIPKFDPSKMNLTSFKLYVDSTQSELQDQLVFRGYENLIKNWRLELECTGRIKNDPELHKMCRVYEDLLKKRRNVKQRKRKVSQHKSKH